MKCIQFFLSTISFIGGFSLKLVTRFSPVIYHILFCFTILYFALIHIVSILYSLIFQYEERHGNFTHFPRYSQNCKLWQFSKLCRNLDNFCPDLNWDVLMVAVNMHLLKYALRNDGMKIMSDTLPLYPDKTSETLMIYSVISSCFWWKFEFWPQ